MLYFGYGSMVEHALDTSEVRPPVRAWLPDQPRVGSTTLGALFDVTDEELAALDRKAGEGSDRISVVVLTDDGDAHQATTHRAMPEHDDQDVSDGRAADATPVFLYGTLMRGQTRHDLIEPHVLSIEPARVPGHLVQIDWYPGLLHKREGEVHGDLVRFREIHQILPTLDEYEDFAGYGVIGSLYRRSLLRAHTQSGAALCWIYVYLGQHEGLPVIESGDWRLR